MTFTSLQRPRIDDVYAFRNLLEIVFFELKIRDCRVAKYSDNNDI